MGYLVEWSSGVLEWSSGVVEWSSGVVELSSGVLEEGSNGVVEGFSEAQNLVRFFIAKRGNRSKSSILQPSERHFRRNYRTKSYENMVRYKFKN